VISGKKVSCCYQKKYENKKIVDVFHKDVIIINELLVTIYAINCMCKISTHTKQESYNKVILNSFHRNINIIVH